ncbi:hairy/enhancer-of-split related with YRPW motif protein 2 isoform X2 [Antennarius striatus]|uniref:hairy/enhancer-of-split related with YRPW motif protein 2 isoform X2 n=1 Tax=Antennarius striatus TaxID=241820 RepID=UPI0035AFAA38
MKRPREDSGSVESEAEENIDVGSEITPPGLEASIRCGSLTTTSHVMARKKRRGVSPTIIEKRRRDRINSSLAELRRLIPTALEKQGSAKLEKAEILQMTVDHLKVLQATRGKGYLDVHTWALDFLSLGFWECVTEVSRYLSAVEGRDSSDPLCARLLSHLTSCTFQRDAAALAVMSHHQQQPRPLPHPFHHHHWVATATAFQPLPTASCGLLGGGAPQRLAEGSQRSVATSYSSYTDSASSSLALSCPPAPLSTSLLSFPISPPPSSSSSQTPPSRRPYRPWGTEVGAF